MITALKTCQSLFSAMILGLFFVSCLKEGAIGEGAELKLEASETSVTVPADEPGQLVLEKTLTITSNRSWSAFCEPAVDWLTLSVSEMENIARTNEKTELILVFKNNEDRFDGRATELVISTADGSVRIPVQQASQVPYIQLLTPAVIDTLSCMEEVSVVRFVSNIEWVASIEAGATAQVVLDTTRGKYSGEVSLTFAENEDTGLEPEAVLVLDDPLGGLAAPVKVSFKQGKALPYIRWKSESQEYKGSLATSLTLDFKTNSDWTAAFAQTVEGFTLPVTSGDKSVNQLTVNLGDYLGLGNKREADVVLSLATGQSASLHISQIATGFVLDFVAGNQPFTTDIEYGTPVVNTQKTYYLSCGDSNYPFVFYSLQGYTFVNGAHGSTCGLMTYKGDWVKLPGVEGWRLKSVELFTSNTGSSANKGFALRETPDGANLASQYVAAHDAVCSLVLTNPDADKNYYVVALNNTGYFSKMTLTYEQ